MTCPYCNHSFPLTWRRYFSSPFGRHVCPQCGRKSKFRLTVSYVAVISVAWIVFYGLALALTVLVFPKTWREILGIPYFAVIFLIGCMVVLPFDKLLDGKFRRLEKLKDEVQPPG